jgi:hypothetical protein
MRNHRIFRSGLVALAFAALTAAPAVAQQDLRNPDTRDAARHIVSDPQQDLRSPDTRDAAAGRGPSTAPDVTVIKVPEPAPTSGAGIDWTDAGLGAAIVLVLAAAGGVAMVLRRRSSPAHTAVAG